jgi:hypothetical protein
LTPSGLRSLSRHRVTGGTSVTVDGFAHGALLVLTPDPLLVGSLTRQIGERGKRAVQVDQQLSRRTLAEVERLLPQLPRDAAGSRATNPFTVSAGTPSRGTSSGEPSNEQLLAAARADLRQSERFSAAGQLALAASHSRQAAEALQRIQRRAWEQAVASVAVKGSLNSAATSPAAVTFATLPAHWALMERIGRSVSPREGARRPGANLLIGGDCEDLPRMLDAGWRHYRRAVDGIVSDVDLSPVTPAAGRSSLHLSARAVESENPPQLVETAPVWVTTAPVRAAPGALLRIAGRVRVPTPISGSVDGLMILDSLAGEALALRVGHAPAWQSFTVYRIATRDAAVTVSCALTGLGDAWIDDVTVEEVESSK